MCWLFLHPLSLRTVFCWMIPFLWIPGNHWHLFDKSPSWLLLTKRLEISRVFTTYVPFWSPDLSLMKLVHPRADWGLFFSFLVYGPYHRLRIHLMLLGFRSALHRWYFISLFNIFEYFHTGLNAKALWFSLTASKFWDVPENRTLMFPFPTADNFSNAS